MNPISADLNADWIPLLLGAVLALALWLRPWRMLQGGRLATPLLGSLVLLPWLWALPQLHAMPLQLQWSGACLVVLMLGWPLAIPVLVVVGVIACLISPAMGWPEARPAGPEPTTATDLPDFLAGTCGSIQPSCQPLSTIAHSIDLIVTG